MFGIRALLASLSRGWAANFITFWLSCNRTCFEEKDEPTFYLELAQLEVVGERKPSGGEMVVAAADIAE